MNSEEHFLSKNLGLRTGSVNGFIASDPETKKTVLWRIFETFSCSDLDANLSLVLWYDEVISIIFIVICGFLSHKLPMKEKDCIYFHWK